VTVEANLTPGYSPSGWLLKELKGLQRTSLLRSIAATLLDHAVIVGCGVAGYIALTSLPLPLAILLVAVFSVLSARSMRGLECLVHDASHLNWSRRRSRNDLAANLLAAWPVMNDVASYRVTHLAHHRGLGSDDDTDLARWQRLELGELRRRELHQFAIGLLRRLIPYLTGWWWAIGLDRKTIGKFVLWHAALLIVACLFFAPSLIFAVWLLGWVLPFVLVLPIIRFVGEIEEHRYDGASSVIEATYTNTGVLHRLVFHPHSDAYHTFHHIFASIPFYRVPRLHRRLMAENLGGYRDLVMERTSLRAPALLIERSPVEQRPAQGESGDPGGQ
jgi:fatty acid desaturase